jgi:hypothetical protein
MSSPSEFSEVGAFADVLSVSVPDEQATPSSANAIPAASSRITHLFSMLYLQWCLQPSDFRSVGDSARTVRADWNEVISGR